MNLLIPVGAGVGLLMLLSGSSKAATAPAPKPLAGGGGGFGGTGTGTGTGKKTAIDFQAPIANAVSKGDANALMAIANEMQAAGLTVEADALRTVALSLQQIGGLGGAGARPPTTSPGQPVLAPSAALPNPPLVVLPGVFGPSTVPLGAGVPVSSLEQQRMQVGQAMAVDLRNTSRYKENQTLVRRFQEQEGLVVDGKYGPKSAVRLSTLGIVPPRPRYWSSKTVQSDKREYAAAMLALASADPTRAADWTAASKVQNDPVK